MGRDLPAIKNGEKPVQSGRDVRGRFLPGWAGGPGRPANPYARQQAALRVAVLDEVQEGDLRAVVRTVLRLARRGNLAAVEMLFRHMIGEVPTPTHPDFLRAHEFAARCAQPGLVDEVALAERVPADPDPADEAPAPASVHQLQEALAWTIRELAEAQTRPALPPPPSPAQSWEAFAASRLQWDETGAVPVDLLFVTYARWAAARGESVLAEEKVWAWLTDHGATIRTATLSQFAMVAGVRLH